MNRKLVACFSASGITAGVARKLSSAIGADYFEIQPQIPYSKADLNWMNPFSRSTREMKDPSSRPVIANRVEKMEAYETVYLGFPIWWFVAPAIIRTFLESYDFSGKTIVLFATSGGSGMGKTAEKLRKLCPQSRLSEGKVFRYEVSEEELLSWEVSLWQKNP